MTSSQVSDWSALQNFRQVATPAGQELPCYLFSSIIEFEASMYPPEVGGWIWLSVIVGRIKEKFKFERIELGCSEE